MSIKNKKADNKREKTNGDKIKKIIKRGMLIIAYIIALFVAQTTTIFATNDPLAVINNLSNFIFDVIRAVGLITLGYGVMQVGMSLKSHDPSQRASRNYDSCRRCCNDFYKGNFKFDYRWIN